MPNRDRVQIRGRAIFGLGLGSFTPEPAIRTLAFSGASLTLEPGAAQAFNEAFCMPIGRPSAFSAGETLGSIAFTAWAE